MTKLFTCKIYHEICFVVRRSHSGLRQKAHKIFIMANFLSLLLLYFEACAFLSLGKYFVRKLLSHITRSCRAAVEKAIKDGVRKRYGGRGGGGLRFGDEEA